MVCTAGLLLLQENLVEDCREWVRLVGGLRLYKTLGLIKHVLSWCFACVSVLAQHICAWQHSYMGMSPRRRGFFAGIVSGEHQLVQKAV